MRKLTMLAMILALVFGFGVAVQAQQTHGSGENLDLPLDPADILGEEPTDYGDEGEPQDPPNEDGPPQLYGEDFPSEESVTYVLDRSGSMGWDSSYYTGPDGSTQYGTLMDRAKFELTTSINRLSDNFKFNVLSYNCSVYTLWNAPRPANDTHKSTATAWVMSQSAYGATGTGPAVVQGLNSEEEHVILLTDGQPNCPYSMSDHESMIVSAANGRKVSCIGIGDYGSFAQFLQRIAASTGGSYVHVD